MCQIYRTVGDQRRTGNAQRADSLLRANVKPSPKTATIKKITANQNNVLRILFELLIKLYSKRFPKTLSIFSTSQNNQSCSFQVSIRKTATISFSPNERISKYHVRFGFIRTMIVSDSNVHLPMNSLLLPPSPQYCFNSSKSPSS